MIGAVGAIGHESSGHRLWAAGTLVLAIATALFAVDVVFQRIPRGLTVVACVVLAVAVAGYGVVRRGAVRITALAVAALLLAVAITLVFVEGDPKADVLIAAGVVATLAAGRRAFRAHVDWPRAQRPARPVLFYNPLSGGGKAERFALAEGARRRGIDPIELRQGDDLERLVREAVTAGADALAMAGGDGSQAIVAMVAAELDLPYACIPSGTRNHFALDLGVDRDDVVGALDAFVNGGERRVDLAEVNGRVFVNNVSLGLYAEAVQRPGYRGAKLRTLLDTVPETLGPDAKPPGLFWDGPAGEGSAAAILVSNNPYRLGRAIGSGTRPRLDRGLLGIAVLAPTQAARNGAVRHRLRMQQWSAPSFEMRADQRVPAGIDGEAIELEPPLRFRIRPGALRVRSPPAILAPHPQPSSRRTRPRCSLPWPASPCAAPHRSSHSVGEP
ncbi:MAG: diacylglycerol kinase [Solirubrobacterales bacterium]|nr:diacylglycerol kinase [Solirubrobacterales bacterium]